MHAKIFRKLNGSLAAADYDDFCSIANMILWQAYNAYDPDMGISFDGFLHSPIQTETGVKMFTISDIITDINRGSPIALRGK